MDKTKFKEIERLQFDCKGFADTASASIFITNDIGLYENGEFKLPIFDAGVFSLNLSYALMDKIIFLVYSMLHFQMIKRMRYIK